MKLNQIVAIENGVKSRTTKALSQSHNMNQKPTLFDGFTATFEKVDEDYIDEPPQVQVVQRVAVDVLSEASEQWIDILDTMATKAYGNMSACADVVMDGVVLMKSAPVPFLLDLEKKIADIKDFVEKLPTLAPAEVWVTDGMGISRSAPVKTRRTVKLEQPIVLYNATPEHPAQTQMITKDVTVGFWNKQHFSGAMKPEDKRAILARIERLNDAVKQAREEANSTTISKVAVGKEVFKFLFGNEVKIH